MNKKDILNNYQIETKRDTMENLIVFLKEIMDNSNLNLLIFEDFNGTKYEKLIKIIKEKDSNLKIIFQINGDLLNCLNKFENYVNLEIISIRDANENKYEELLNKFQII